MATPLYKGTIIPNPYFQYTTTGKPLLKLKIRLKDDTDKRINVVVWGAQAEKHSEIEPGTEVIVTGTWKTNEWQGKETQELHLGDYGGNLRLTGAKGKAVMAHGDSAPQRRREAEEDRHREVFGYPPDLSDPPDTSGWPSPTDKEFNAHASYDWTRYMLSTGELIEPEDEQQSFRWE